MPISEYIEFMNETDLEQNPKLIVKIILASHRELHKKRPIRYGQIRTKSNHLKNTIIKSRLSGFSSEIKEEEKSITGETLTSIIDSLERERLITVHRDKNTKGKTTKAKIYVKFSLVRKVKKEIKTMQAENLLSPNKRLLRLVNGIDHVYFTRSPKYVESVPISDKLSRSVNRHRSLPIETVTVSDKLGGSVIYADKKKEIKKL
jgi:hypothetical protein